jgi:hypothetical protein
LNTMIYEYQAALDTYQLINLYESIFYSACQRAYLSDSADLLITCGRPIMILCAVLHCQDCSMPAYCANCEPGYSVQYDGTCAQVSQGSQSQGSQSQGGQNQGSQSQASQNSGSGSLSTAVALGEASLDTVDIAQLSVLGVLGVSFLIQIFCMCSGGSSKVHSSSVPKDPTLKIGSSSRVDLDSSFKFKRKSAQEDETLDSGRKGYREKEGGDRRS